MKILYGYDYVDSTGFEARRVVVKCRILFFDNEEDGYIKSIRERFNPKNVPYSLSLRARELKLEPYFWQL